jgi:pimeloyl-ACP methyl ester carboxylesterase
MPTLSLPDVDIWFERHGAGRQVMLCNGSGASIEGTRPLIDRLAQHCEVLVHDQRCLGRSGIPDHQPTMAEYGADVAALLDHVGWQRPAVVGISFGGMVAQEFAVTHPDRLDRLALLCTSPGGAGGASYPLHEVASLEPAEQARLQVRLLDGRFDEAWLADHPADRALVETMAAARSSGAPSPERLRGHAMQLEARRHHDVWDRLERITCPTLVMCGEFDELAPAANSEAIVSRIAGAHLRSYQGGHLFVYQDRAAFGDLVEFLRA